ncbi:MAG: co-chaperone GroES [Thermoguttaceae bacterium]|nr:co-chaperone GroES [Thermoguttaceae bacterium]MDW8079952.1 co-chaperone GroES [Thermoguttaceae bacterium]
MKLVPLGASIIVRPLRASVGSGQLVMPEDFRSGVSRGRVLSVGDGRLLPNGGRATPQVAEGDCVLYEDFAGIPVEINGEKLLLLTEDEILAIEG